MCVCEKVYENANLRIFLTITKAPCHPISAAPILCRRTCCCCQMSHGVRHATNGRRAFSLHKAWR